MHATRHAAVALALAVGAAGTPRESVAQAVLSGNLTADNAFFAYLSTSANSLGTLIGSGNNWGATFSLTPTTLSPGTTYYLNIEVINYGLNASLIGDFTLSSGAASFADGSQALSTGTANWLGGYNSGNSTVAPQAWVAPAGTVYLEGANGIGPWGLKSGIAAATQWIWPADASSAPGGLTQAGACQFCTADFQTRITTAVPEPATNAMILTGLAVVLLAARRRSAT